MKIEYDRVSYRYAPDAVPALSDLCLTLDTQALIGIWGMAGAGKSTLLQHLNGLLRPTSGVVRIDGENIHQTTDGLRRIRQRVGLTFQFPERQFWGHTVAEECVTTLARRQYAAHEIEQRIATAAAWLGFDFARRRAHSPFHLSRSEQRVFGILVLLTLQPELLALDEPTAGLDRRQANRLLDALRQIHRQHGVRIILVSHHLELLLKYAEVLILLHGGNVVHVGPPAGVLPAIRRLDIPGLKLPPFNDLLTRLQSHYPDLDPTCLSVEAAIAELDRFRDSAHSRCGWGWV